MFDPHARYCRWKWYILGEVIPAALYFIESKRSRYVHQALFADTSPIAESQPSLSAAYHVPTGSTCSLDDTSCPSQDILTDYRSTGNEAVSSVPACNGYHTLDNFRWAREGTICTALFVSRPWYCQWCGDPSRTVYPGPRPCHYLIHAVTDDHSPETVSIHHVLSLDCLVRRRRRHGGLGGES